MRLRVPIALARAKLRRQRATEGAARMRRARPAVEARGFSAPRCARPGLLLASTFTISHGDRGSLMKQSTGDSKSARGAAERRLRPEAIEDLLEIVAKLR